MTTHNFKVGDRVAIYSSDRMVGTVDEIRSDGSIWCRVSRNGQPYWNGLTHPKQLRRLKPKKRREFWIKESVSGCPGAYYPPVISTIDPKQQDIIQDNRPWIHVREVREK